MDPSQNISPILRRQEFARYDPFGLSALFCIISLCGAVLELLVKMLMLLMQAIVTIGRGFAMCGSQIGLGRSLGMDRAG